MARPRAHQPFMPAILARLAPQLGAEVWIEPEFQLVGRIRFANGRQSFFWENKFNLNSVSAAKIAQDKGYTLFFLRGLGYSVPPGCMFFEERFRRMLGSPRGLAAAVRYAHEIGWPVFIKPCRRSQGEGVSMAANPAELRTALRALFAREHTVLVERACAGRDYRLVVLDGAAISAYERRPLSVTGDGRATIAQLLARKQREFDECGRDTRIPLRDPRFLAVLRRRGLGLASIPAAGEEVRLLDVANLSLGGSTHEVTDRLHPGFARLAARLAADLDLRFAGIDLLASDITRAPGEYYVIEVNSAPGLDHYAGHGPAHEARIDALYLRVLEAVARGPAAPRPSRHAV